MAVENKVDEENKRFLSEEEIKSICLEMEKSREAAAYAVYAADTCFVGEFLHSFSHRDKHKYIHGLESHLRKFHTLEAVVNELQLQKCHQEAEGKICAFFRELDRWDIVEDLVLSYCKHLDESGNEGNGKKEQRKEKKEQIKSLKAEWDAGINQLMEPNYALLNYIVKKYLFCQGMDFNLLYEEAEEGMRRAVHKFNFRKCENLANYMSKMMKSFVRTAIRDKAASYRNDSLYDARADERPLIEFIPDHNSPNPEEAYGDLELAVEIGCRMASALKALELREREIIKMLYGLSESKEYSQMDVAQVFGRSRSRIQQLEQRALQKLRKSFNVGEAESGDYV